MEGVRLMRAQAFIFIGCSVFMVCSVHCKDPFSLTIYSLCQDFLHPIICSFHMVERNAPVAIKLCLHVWVNNVCLPVICGDFTVNKKKFNLQGNCFFAISFVQDKAILHQGESSTGERLLKTLRSTCRINNGPSSLAVWLNDDYTLHTHTHTE